MPSLPNLAWLKSFEAAGRLGSFTAAGAELGLTQAAISNHISSLESRLGHKLLERTTRKVDLTASGRAYLPSIRKCLLELAMSTDALFGGRAAGTVTIRAPISAAVLVISPALLRFRELHPELDIRLLSAIWADTVLDTGIDIEIRLGTGEWSGFRNEMLGADHVVPVCHPAIAAGLKTPADLVRLPRAHILGFDDHWTRYFEAENISPAQSSPAVTVDTSLAAVEWAASGGGVALILERAARTLAETGRLAVPFKTKIPLGQAHYLIHKDGTSPPSVAVRLVEGWLRDLFSG